MKIIQRELIDKVIHLISRHEIGGDDDQNLLMDADSLSFVENNADIFLSRYDELGYDKIKEKFDWMFNRISSEERKDMVQPSYEDMIRKLESLKK